MLRRGSIYLFALLFFLTSQILSPFKSFAQTKTRPLTILYLPIDNRPITRDYLSALADMGTDTKVLLPPASLLNSGSDLTDQQPIWDWVYANLDQADALVLSLDSLYYGGLVPSRKHTLPQAELEDSFLLLKKLVAGAKVPVYLFSTVMRSLTDNPNSRYLTKDALNRRRVNIEALERSLLLVSGGYIDYFAIGIDDSPSYIRGDKDISRLSRAVLRVNKAQKRVEFFHGADEIGLLLFARALNRLSSIEPKVFVTSLNSLDNKAIPLYEDRPIGSSIALRVGAAGGVLVKEAQGADLVLLINLPAGPTKEASSQGGALKTKYHEDLAKKISSLIDNGSKVALADIAYANGGDDALMGLLAQRGLLSDLAAYAGWNTASNSIGTALASGLVYNRNIKTASLDSSGHLKSLLIRMIEDWGYQGRVRRQILDHYGFAHSGLSLPSSLSQLVQFDLNQRLNLFLGSDLSSNFGNLRIYNLHLPWGRLFEIGFDVGLSY